ncbi:MAG: hypothetical protein WAR37_00770 [Candidatus Microsaccharimonas sp.]
MFLIETYVAFRRIGKPLDKGGEYLHATWEVTHTFLILALNYFMWLYSAAVIDVSREIFLPLIIFGGVFIIRAILYLYLFHIKGSDRPSLIADWVFAITHAVMLLTISWVAIAATHVLITGNYISNHVLLPLLYPGLFLMIPLIAVPVYFLYKTKLK